MDDVIGYEEGKPEIAAAVHHAYPRFVIHPYIKQAAAHIKKNLELKGRCIILLAQQSSVASFVDFLKLQDYSVCFEADFTVIHFIDTADNQEAARYFLQHTGIGISSRQAEDYLLGEGILPEAQHEKRFQGNTKEYMASAMSQYMDSDDIFFTRSGMAAFYAGFEASRQVQEKKGRKIYLQLGWLYLDTQRILEKFLDPDERLIVHYNVFDRAGLEKIFHEYGAELAAVITEVPTNPLIQTTDLEFLSQLCLKHGVIRLLDPSLVSVLNVDILAHSDVLVNSLTKYSSWSGDVMSGLAAVNPGSPFRGALCRELHKKAVEPYIAEFERMAYLAADMAMLVSEQNANAVRLIDFLQKHPAVSRVYHALEGKSKKHYTQIARSQQSIGAIISIELNKPIAEFYDRVPIVKGPSFGTQFTMMCPYMYLAHYDLVNQEQGRTFLKNNGIDPDLIRISCGREPFEEIQSAFEVGLDDR